MTVPAAPARPRPSPRRRRRAGQTVAGALRGGLFGTGVAALAWFAAGALAGIAFLVLLLVSVAAVAWVLLRGGLPRTVWLGLAAAWVVVLIEREVVQSHGGVWVAVAAWLGVAIGARRAGISRWALPLLAFPLVPIAIAVLAGEPLLSPWGSSWLWVPAVLAPVVGARTALGSASRG